jgi:acyl carrier protein
MPVTRDDVLAAIHEAKAVQDVSKLRDEMKLTDQGVDSLEMFNVLLVISEKYDIDIPDEDSNDLNTISQIVDYLNRKLS